MEPMLNANNVINIPADSIFVQLPMRMGDRDVRIMFRSIEAVEETIEKLTELKKQWKET